MIKAKKSCLVCLKKDKKKYYHCWDDNNEVGYICKDCVSEGKLKQYNLKLASTSSYLFQRVKDLLS